MASPPRRDHIGDSFTFEPSNSEMAQLLGFNFDLNYLEGMGEQFPSGHEMAAAPPSALVGKAYESQSMDISMSSSGPVKVNDLPPEIPNPTRFSMREHPVADSKVPSARGEADVVGLPSPPLELLPVHNFGHFDNGLSQPLRGELGGGVSGPVPVAAHTDQNYSPSQLRTSPGLADSMRMAAAGAAGFHGGAPAPELAQPAGDGALGAAMAADAPDPHVVDFGKLGSSTATDALAPASPFTGKTLPVATAGYTLPGLPPPPPKVVMEVVKPEAKAVPGEGQTLTLGRTTHVSKDAKLTDEDGMLSDENTDEEGMSMRQEASQGKSALVPRDKRRLERNAREQRRSKKITNQIDELKDLLRQAGRPVKANKASILSETAEYIQELQKQRMRLEESVRACSDDEIPAGPTGFGLGGVGGAGAAADVSGGVIGRGGSGLCASARSVNEISYRHAFHDSGVPMAIATMDGCFVESNRRFMEVSLFTKAELLRLTIFNLTAAGDLQQTFARVSNMLRSADDTPFFTARAVMKHNKEQGFLSISLVRDDLRRPIFFSVCIVGRNTPPLVAAVATAAALRTGVPGGVPSSMDRPVAHSGAPAAAAVSVHGVYQHQPRPSPAPSAHHLAAAAPPPVAFAPATTSAANNAHFYFHQSHYAPPAHPHAYQQPTRFPPHVPQPHAHPHHTAPPSAHHPPGGVPSPPSSLSFTAGQHALPLRDILMQHRHPPSFLAADPTGSRRAGQVPRQALLKSLQPIAVDKQPQEKPDTPAEAPQDRTQAPSHARSTQQEHPSQQAAPAPKEAASGQRGH